MSFLTPLAFLGVLIAIPIILLYMLRLRRRELVVSSNFLWQQILRDQEANTPWQRLRRNILLILQLIILALLVLALARPAQIVPTISSGKTVILLDASASMSATDLNGRTRFQEAQDQANIIVGASDADDELAIIRVGEVAEPLTAYTQSIAELRQAINSAEVGQGSGDWDTALTLAAAGAEGADNFTIVVISDGGIGESLQLPENIPQPVYVPVGESSENLAISALATRALPGQNPQLFAQVDHYGSEDVEVSLVVRLDGELWDSVTQTVSANSQRSFIFQVDQAFETIEAELVFDDSVVDHLASDNVAYAVTSDVSSRRVLLVSAQPNRFVEQVLRSLPGVQLFRGDETRTTVPTQQYDLYVFNGWLPDILPDSDMLILNPPRSTPLFSLGEAAPVGNNIRVVERSHPTAQFLSVDNLNVQQARTLNNIDWATPIVGTEALDLVVAGEDNGRQVVLLPFNLLESDLPLQIAWPLLISNTLEWFSPANVLGGRTALTVGDTLRVNLPLNADGARITLPDESIVELDMTGATNSFTQTQQRGLYRLDVLAGGEIAEAQGFAVNLFGTDESDITPVAADDLLMGGGASDAEAEEQFGFREFWPGLAGLALLILLIEWRTYYRRLRPVTTERRPIDRSTAR